VLAACASIAGEPSMTTLPEDMSDEMRDRAVAVCYAASASTREDLEAAAKENCPEPGSSVAFRSEDLVFNDCPMVKKRRAVFLCTAPK
jgi:hypothetical protein